MPRSDGGDPLTRWYRAYEGTVSDPKLAEAALIAGCSRSVAVAAWHLTLENAATVNDGGRIDIPTRRIAAALCEPLAVVGTLVEAFTAIGLVTGSHVTAWDDLKGSLRPSAAEWATIRDRIFARDGYACRYCGEHGQRLECDHVMPVARGGDHEDENLVTACFTCNRKKRDRTPEEMGWSL